MLLPVARSLKLVSERLWNRVGRYTTFQPSRTLTMTCRGQPIDRDELFRYTNGRHLVNEEQMNNCRYLAFDVNQLCAVAASVGERQSPVHAIEKMEGGNCRALLMRKEDGTEIVAKIPFSIAGPPKYTTASEVAVLRYLHTHTQVPVPKVLAWNDDASNPVGAEYIIMEKAPGVQLQKKWGDMSGQAKLDLVLHLLQLQGEMVKLEWPVSGSLYLRESMTDDDTWVALKQEMDPSSLFCIGPSCERAWNTHNKTQSLHSRFNRGPWPTWGSLGTAIVERETILLEQNTVIPSSCTSRGSIDEHMAALKLTKQVMELIDKCAFVTFVARPVLWHTDLHMGNIYVSEEDPSKIVSLIDWQSATILPMFLQAEHPKFLPVSDFYTFGFGNRVEKPPNYDNLDAEKKEFFKMKFTADLLAKFYELKSPDYIPELWLAFSLPSFVSGLFTRCAEVSTQGEITLRDSLIKFAAQWDDMKFESPCPFTFTEDDLKRHTEQLDKYHEYYAFRKVVTEYLQTDDDGWIAPTRDFRDAQEANELMLRDALRNSSKFGMTPEQIRKTWPFPPREEFDLDKLAVEPSRSE